MFGFWRTRLHLIEFFRGETKACIVVTDDQREAFPLRYRVLKTLRSSEITRSPRRRSNA